MLQSYLPSRKIEECVLDFYASLTKQMLCSCLTSFNLVVDKVMFFWTVQNCSFSMGIIFCSNVALVWTFHTRGVYDFFTKEASIPVNLVSLFTDVPFLFCRFLKSGLMNEQIIFFSERANKSELFVSNRAKLCYS